MQQSSVAAASNNSQQAAPSVAVPAPLAPHSAVELPTLPPSAANTTTLFSTNYTNPCNTVMTSCAGCVQQQFQCNQIPCPGVSTDAMEMTAALLHSQPPLQLVSCHGPIMHPATPSNQRYVQIQEYPSHPFVNHYNNDHFTWSNTTAFDHGNPMSSSERWYISND